MIRLFAQRLEPKHAVKMVYVNSHHNQRKFVDFFLIPLWLIIYHILYKKIRRVQFGLWDGSIEPGTAEWSRGPIDVSYNII